MCAIRVLAASMSGQGLVYLAEQFDCRAVVSVR
jgi:hypothetical protein